MTTPPGRDLAGLITWLGQNEWPDRLNTVLWEHVDPVIQEFDLEAEQIGEVLGNDLAMALWSCAFEDFLTRRFGPDDENPIEVYLRRRGWKERAITRNYMGALQTSVMSLYEASDIVPGESFRARDLIRGGDPLLISERTATRTLQPWERIAARVLHEGPKMIIAGGVLPFTMEASQLLLAELGDAFTRPARRSRRRRPPLDGLEEWGGTDDNLRDAAPFFTAVWMFDALPRALGTNRPTLLNTEGDEVVFHNVVFPLAPNASRQEIARRLGKLRSLRQETPTFWNWIGEAPSKTAKSGNTAGLTWNVTMDDGTLVLGNVELTERTLSLSVNSAVRAERGKAMLTAALTSLVGSPLTEIQTLEQVRDAPGPKAEPSSEIPPNMQTELVHAILDKQYRATLDQPVSMLGDISPRAAARSARGRRNLAAWLKYIENQSRNRSDADDPLATYDFSWMWRELKVEELRK